MNPDVTQENIQETVCLSEWVEKVQPPASYTDRLKAKQIKALHLLDPFRKAHRLPAVLLRHIRVHRSGVCLGSGK